MREGWGVALGVPLSERVPFGDVLPVPLAERDTERLNVRLWDGLRKKLEVRERWSVAEAVLLGLAVAVGGGVKVQVAANDAVPLLVRVQLVREHVRVHSL